MPPGQDEQQPAADREQYADTEQPSHVDAGERQGTTAASVTASARTEPPVTCLATVPTERRNTTGPAEPEDPEPSAP
ncbi:MAG: hypothetical protein AUI14_12945 [Actinobacteria bacterium 13_2_20CM_2_71_6]|nr:MAG: hypothetical protein AUI14_12945 [Actinobacteria bacterium 13_2_20CM_2_71_6]